MAIQDKIDAADRRVIISLNKAFARMDNQLRDLMSELDSDNGLLVRDVANTNKANALLQKLRSSMSAEYRNIYASEIKALQDMTKAIIEESGDIGIPRTMTDVTKAEVKSFMNTNVLNLQKEFESVVDEMDDLVKSSISGTLDFQEATKAISAKLGTRLHQAETLASTGLMNFQRTIMTTQADEAGVDWYAYMGPKDTHTREFCSHVAGKRYTLKQLESLSGSFGRNPNLVPVSMWLGGYNCRHRLVPLVDEEDIKRYKKGPTGRKG